jgi:hypothetical protein
MLATGFLLQIAVITARPFHVEFVVEKVVLGQVLSMYISFSVILPIVHTRISLSITSAV